MLQNMFILNAAMQGAYHWSEGTGWDDCWIIIIRLSQNQQLNEKRWRSPFYNSIIRYCFPRWETGNWKLENWANGKGLSNARIRTNSECSLQFGTVFSENYSSIRLSSEHSGILAQWRVNIHNHLYKCLRLQNVPYDKCRRTILRCWCRWHPSGSCVFQTNTHWHLKRDHNRIAKKTFVFFFLGNSDVFSVRIEHKLLKAWTFRWTDIITL